MKYVHLITGTFKDVSIMTSRILCRINTAVTKEPHRILLFGCTSVRQFSATALKQELCD